VTGEWRFHFVKVFQYQSMGVTYRCR
jgi:hypothetical protein